MANHGHDADSLANRKTLLVAQGAAYRSEIRAAEHAIAEDLHLGKIIKSVLSHVAVAAYAALKSRSESTGVKLQTLLPLVIGGVSALQKRSLLKPALRVALLFGAAAVTWLLKKRKTVRGR